MGICFGLHTIITQPYSNHKNWFIKSTSIIFPNTTKILHIQQYNESCFLMSWWEYASPPTPSSLVLIQNQKMLHFPHPPSHSLVLLLLHCLLFNLNCIFFYCFFAIILYTCHLLSFQKIWKIQFYGYYLLLLREYNIYKAQRKR